MKGHWHNCNRIKTASGIKWLTIPVKTSGRLGQPIDHVEIGKPWTEQHWSTLELAYKHAAHFELTVTAWYVQTDPQTQLTNAIFLRCIAGLLGLKTASSID